MNKGKILTPLVLDEYDKKDIIDAQINDDETPGEHKSNEDIIEKKVQNNKNENCNISLFLGSLSFSIIGLILIIKICLILKFSILFVYFNSLWILLWFLNFFFFISSINDKLHCGVLTCFFSIGLTPSIVDFFIFKKKYLRFYENEKAFVMAYKFLSIVNIILYIIIIVLYYCHTLKIKKKKKNNNN